MANTKEYKEGYDAAIQSLKDMLNGQNNQNQDKTIIKIKNHKIKNTLANS